MESSLLPPLYLFIAKLELGMVVRIITATVSQISTTCQAECYVLSMQYHM